jgi:choline dehydrogenase-like flavoprotein
MIDDARQIDSGARLSADICIIGAGAAGIALALQFVWDNRSVLVLESGDLKPDAQTQALYRGEVADEDLHSPPDTYRQRRFGGSTTIWGGRCMPFDPVDFKPRGYIPDSGWPLGYDQLLPYYTPANALCEAGEFAYTAETAFPQGMAPVIAGFDSPRISTNSLERFSCPTDFGRRYGHRLAASRNVRVLLNANCTELCASADGGRIEGLTVQTLTGRRFTVAAQYVVLATGGLEVPRLLLASRTAHANGIGNAADLVGRYYMCHIAGTLGRLTINGPSSRVNHGYAVSPDGVYCRRRLAVNESAQQELEIGNFIARLHHPRITDPAHRTGALSALYLGRNLISYEYRKRLYDQKISDLAGWLRHVRNVALDPFGTAGFVAHMIRKRVLVERKFPSIIVSPRSRVFSIDFHAEQQPNPASRVTLTSQQDRLGMPQLRVDWRYTAGDIRTVAVAFDLLAKEIARSGCGRLDYDPATLEEEVMRDGAFGGHHSGTARMSATPSKGVVDADCRVHGVHNLFIASSAVFPTSSQANPTLTIVALALRLADHLKQLSTSMQGRSTTNPIAKAAAGGHAETLGAAVSAGG